MSFDGRSSSASSIDSTGSFETLQDPRDLKLQRLEAENVLLRRELMDKRTAAQELRESTLKAQISGAWKIVASKNFEEFFEQHSVSELNSIVFQVADIHFQFDQNNVLIFQQFGNKRYNEYVLKFGELTRSSGGLSTTYFTENGIKTTDVEQRDEHEITVEEGHLKVVVKSDGVRWERIYRRESTISTLRNEIEHLNVSNQALQRTVDKKRKESVEQKVELENLKSMLLKLQSDLKEQSLEKDVELENLKRTVLKIKEENEKFQQTIEKLQKNQKELLNSQQAGEPDIKKSIIGVWRDKNVHARTVAFKIDEQGNILQKWYGDADFIVRTLCVRDAFGWTFYFENNRLVRKWTNPNGEIIHHYEWFVEDGELILVAGFSRTVFEKISE